MLPTDNLTKRERDVCYLFGQEYAVGSTVSRDKVDFETPCVERCTCEATDDGWVLHNNQEHLFIYSLQNDSFPTKSHFQFNQVCEPKTNYILVKDVGQSYARKLGNYLSLLSSISLHVLNQIWYQPGADKGLPQKRFGIWKHCFENFLKIFKHIVLS